MEIIITTTIYLFIWINISSISSNIINSFNQEKIYSKINISLNLSLGFLMMFIILGTLNIFFHFFGITIKYHSLFIIIPPILIISNKKNIINFYKNIKSDINSIFNDFHKYEFKKNPLIISLIGIIIIQCVCLFLRYLLPVSHGDALGQYFYDSLQISRLEDISLINYYQMGFALRTDSLASFFDALIIQLTNNWTLVRTIRVISLLLVILNCLELTFNLGKINIKRSILLISIILTTPDVWDIALSGKHDIYLSLFQLTGIYTIFKSISYEQKLAKIIFSSVSLFISITTVCIRLSSLSLLLISLIVFFYNIFNSKFSINFKEIKKINLSLIAIIFSSIFLLISVLLLGILNYKYLSNPLYLVSPPEFLKTIFPQAVSNMDYEAAKERMSLINIPNLIKPIATILYATLGLEPIRYILNKLENLFILPTIFANALNFIGPREMMVSILSLSPFTLIAFFQINLFKTNKKQFFLLILVFWILFWTLSIPYTRIALASSFSLIVFALAEPINNFTNPLKNKFLENIKNLIIIYGLMTIYLFSIWSVSTLWDLPLKKLLTNNYDRKSLTREFILTKNAVLKQNQIPPSQKFEKEWENIELKNDDSYLFLANSPKEYAYFMNKGLLKSSKLMNKGLLKSSKENVILKKIKNKSLCFQIDQKESIQKVSCNK